MPIYSYQCVDCGGQDLRVGGLDDHTALCVDCGGLMLRLDEDLFQPYFEAAAAEEVYPQLVRETLRALSPLGPGTEILP